VSGVGSRCLCRSAKSTRERKERESNPQGLFGSAVFETAAIARWLAPPLGARDRGEGREEPAGFLAPHPSSLIPRESGWLDSNQRSPAPEAGGFNQALPHPERRNGTRGT
jgi:hypothetical protein